MCRRTTCPVCEQPAYNGCGLHIEQVLGDVPKPDRCACNGDGKAAKRPGLLARLFSS